ncbi:hypothetical protein F2Q68_00034082 [Brassica cretica]|uniref:Uncharacterized protein n=1 Tax=Brassica cretica TaxID=69181 RepID=A0A8S9H0Q4_BRACR|nr:hypothetical protein F2Q68_00034082 [Brassica cretica]
MGKIQLIGTRNMKRRETALHSNKCPPSCSSRHDEAVDTDHAAIGARTKLLEPPEVLPPSAREDHAPPQTAIHRIRSLRSLEPPEPASVHPPPESHFHRTSVAAGDFSGKRRRWRPVIGDSPVDSATQLVDRSSRFGLLIELRFVNSKSVRN